MNAHDGLLAAISETPDDDVPRLIYADWLDEQGDSARAEFIRLQCRAVSLPWEEERDALEDRAEELLRQHEDEWLGAEGEFVREGEYRRGFLERVRTEPQLDPPAIHDLFRIGPNCTIRIEPVFGLDLPASVAAIAFERLKGLDIRAWPIAEITECLAELDRWPQLETLLLSPSYSPSNEALSGECFTALMQYLPRLRHLHAVWHGLGSNHLVELLGRSELSELRTLDLRTSFGEEGAVVLASSPTLAALETLSFLEPTARGMHLLADRNSHLEARLRSAFGRHVDLTARGVW